jgi:2-(1,2-epoxy-1,2-dihydrophenyl)acetyl-CoA isomerase
MTTNDFFTIETADRVTTISIDRPDVLNAFTYEMLVELRTTLTGLECDDATRALIITGTGRAFSAGADLTARPHTPKSYSQGQMVAASLTDGWNPLVRCVKDFPKPTVAAVNGLAIGAAIGIALACDVTLAARSAFFQYVFVPELAMIPDAGATWFLPNQLGRARARALVLLGEKLDAETAADWGLIWKCLDGDQLLTEATRVARRLANSSLPAIAAAKEALDRGPHETLDRQLELEALFNRELGDRPGFAEGKRAFREKRRPNFRDA